MSPNTPVAEQLAVRDVSVHLYRGGSGPPLLYLHGLGPNHTWLPVHELLAQRFTVYAPDLPGFGGSTRPSWLETVTDYVFHLLDLLDVLGLQRVHLVGASLGGWIAAELATVASERLRSLILVDAPGVFVEGVETPDLFLLSYTEQYRLMVHDPSVAEQLLQSVGTSPDDELRRIREQVTVARVAWNPYFYNPKLAGRLHRVTMPTLIVWGDHDRLFPQQIGRAYQEAIPGAQFCIIEGCGHLPPIEKPEAFVKQVTDFLAHVS